MKKFFLLVVSVVFSSAAIGFLFAAMTDSPSGDWLTVQENTGRPPRLIALLAFAPILVTGVLAAIKYFYKKIKEKR